MREPLAWLLFWVVYDLNTLIRYSVCVVARRSIEIDRRLIPAFFSVLLRDLQLGQTAQFPPHTICNAAMQASKIIDFPDP